MAEQTAIEWCDATFNPWIGCTKVSPACDHCYAAVSTPARVHCIEWGVGQPRRRTSPANWKLPLRWNRADFQQCGHCAWRGEIDTLVSDACPSCGKHEHLESARRRVFCASLADVFDNEVPGSWRADLFGLIRATPNLDWLLLTKRIGNAVAMMDEAGGWSGATVEGVARQPLPNVWLGATACNQAELDHAGRKLRAVPARVRFLSIEPLLAPVSLRWLPVFDGKALKPRVPGGETNEYDGARVFDWVIAGGESGTGARPMHPDWVRSLRDQCAAAGVPFLFKQWGEWLPGTQYGESHRAADPDDAQSRFRCVDWNGTEFFDSSGHAEDVGEDATYRIGKKLAGRTLDGATHTAFPEVR